MQVSEAEPQHFINTIPYDVWTVITHWLDARDILSLQSTCRRCREVMHQRALWTSALQAMCRLNGVFYPSYPVASMNVDQIMRAALAPHAVTRNVRSATCDLGPGTRLAPTIKAALTQSFVGEGDIYANDVLSLLVPGGRFLVVSHSQGTVLSLWDLGLAGQKTHQPRCIAEMDLDPTESAGPPIIAGWRRRRSVIAVSMDSGDTLRVAALVHSSRFPSTMTIQLLSIKPLQDAKFTLIGGPLVFQRASGQAIAAKEIFLDGDAIALCLSDSDWTKPPSFIVNFVEGWYVRGPETPGEVVIFRHNTLVCAEVTHVTVLDILPLLECHNQTSIAQGSRVRVEETYPLDDRAIAPVRTFELEYLKGSLVRPLPWRSGDLQSPHRVAFHSISLVQHNLNQRFLTLERTKGNRTLNASLTLEATYHIHGDHFLVAHACHTSLLDPDQFIATAVRYEYLERNTAWVTPLHPWGVYHLPPSPANRDRGSRHLSGNGAGSDDQRKALQLASFPVKRGDIGFLGFCMWSGRLIYVEGILEEGVRRKYLHVVDFIEL